MSSAPRRPRPSSDDHEPAADAVSITGRRPAAESLEQTPNAVGDARLETFEQGAVRQPDDAPDASPASLAGGTQGRGSATDEP
jgi:hypothetical protein